MTMLLGLVMMNVLAFLEFFERLILPNLVHFWVGLPLHEKKECLF
jgi:hypothetical protein